MAASQVEARQTSALAWVGLAVPLAIGAFLRFWQLSTQSQFLDEAFTISAAGLPIGDMLRFLAAHDAHPPLFYLLGHAAVTTLHWPPTWYRFLTAPVGLLTIVAVWALARRLYGDLAAALAAFFIATEPTLLLFDRMFRMYGMLIALTATSFWLLTAALAAEGPRRRILWLVYGVVTIALPSIQYLGALVVFCQGLYALADLRRRWPVIAAGVGAILALVPWWWGIKEQWPQAGLAGGQTLVWSWSLVRTLLGYCLPVGWYRAAPFDVIFTLVALGVLAAGLWLARGGMMALFLAPLVLQAAATTLFHRNLIYARYLVYMIPAFALAFGLCAATLLRSKARVAGLLLVALAVVINGVADTNLFVDKFYQLSDWNLVASLMEAHEKPTDIIVFDQGYPYVVMQSSPAVVNHRLRGPEQPFEVPPTIRWLDANKNVRVWYVENQPEYPDPARLIKKHLERTRPRLREWLEPRAEAGNIVFIGLYGPVRGVKR